MAYSNVIKKSISTSRHHFYFYFNAMDVYLLQRIYKCLEVQDPHNWDCFVFKKCLSGCMCDVDLDLYLPDIMVDYSGDETL